jgi:hypothetical protein
MKYLLITLKLLLSYLLAGAAFLLYYEWPYDQANSHVPFSSFPEFLVWSPMAPVILFDQIIKKPIASLFGLVIFSIVFIVSMWLFFRRKNTLQSTSIKSPLA